ncbi:MAG: methyltransferase domain-containing protein [Candidatus Orphnella occulta]|nr:methyltransferase domain-containing protein [Candidatus Orphnella occulta]
MDKRSYSRIDASFPIVIPPDIIGETVDISETGLGLIFRKPLLLSKAKAKIEISPNNTIETEFKLIWDRRLTEKSGFRYGVCLVRLKDKDLSILQDILIQRHLEQAISKVDNPELREKVTCFIAKDCKEYICKFDAISRGLKNSSITKDEADNRVKNITDSILQKGNNLESLIDNKVAIKKVKEAFRAICGPLGYKGRVVKRAFDKPRGYPGDYLMIEAVYDNKSISKGIGSSCDMYFLNDRYATAVRNRKDLMRQKLIHFLSNSDAVQINVLNIACGSCREIDEIFSAKSIPDRKYKFTLIDHDDEALLFSKKALSSSKSKKIELEFLQHDISNYIKEQDRYVKILGKQDLVYSIGLADYLPDRILKKLILFCSKLLKPKGSLILAHKDKDAYKPVSTDWWCDWTFYPRNEDKLLNIIKECGMGTFDISIDREKSKTIIFITLTKK